MNLPDPINENGPAAPAPAPASTASNTDSNAAHVSPRAKTNVSKRSPSLSVTAEKVPCHTYIHHTYIHTYFMSCILNRIQLLNSLLLFTYYYPILLFIHTYIHVRTPRLATPPETRPKNLPPSLWPSTTAQSGPKTRMW